MSHAALYLVAELATLADELRNPHATLSRSQLADLAERARRDAASLASIDETPARVRAAPAIPESGAKVIPLFGARVKRKKPSEL